MEHHERASQQEQVRQPPKQVGAVFCYEEESSNTQKPEQHPVGWVAQPGKEASRRLPLLVALVLRTNHCSL